MNDDLRNRKLLDRYCLVTLEMHGVSRPAQRLTGIPLFMADLTFVPVEYLDTGERDAVRSDLLRPMSEMQIIARMACDA